MDGARFPIALDLQSKHPVMCSEVCNFDMLAQASLKLLNESSVAGGNCAVIHMDCDNYEFTFLLV